jgi:alpha-glucosidase
MSWWQEGVIYQIYPRSYADSNGDGVGDLRGIVERLDHLAWLGVEGIWVCPITVSPDTDWGYDVADYCRVHPAFGSLDDLDLLVAEAGRRGIKVLLDLVPNHTSSKHPWFRNARTRTAPRRDFYVWADPKPDGSPPNNWLSSFGGPAWTLDPVSRQYYLHNFLPSQPDLNWWNEEVRDAFDEILRFWFDRGVAGFRIDAAHAIVKDKELRDNPPVEPGDHPYVVAQGQRKVYNSERPEAHDVFRRWRAIAESYDPPRALLGETYVLDVAALPAFYGDADELQMAFNFVFLHEPFRAGALRRVIEAIEQHLIDPAWPVWAVSTHDLPRFPTRWCDEQDDRSRCALMMLLTLRGTPVLYYGDELGMPDVPVPPELRRDPVGTGAFSAGPGRDPCRTPMLWAPGPGGGFTAPGVRPWLPIGLPPTPDQPAPGMTVEEQRADPASMLHLCRDLIALRRELDDLRLGSYVSISTGTPRTPGEAPEGIWAFRRGSDVVVALNLSDSPGKVTLDGFTGEVRVGTRRERDGEAVDGRLALGPWEGAVISARH